MVKIKRNILFFPLFLTLLLMKINPWIGISALAFWISNFLGSRAKGIDLSEYSSLRPSPEMIVSFSALGRKVIYKGRRPPRASPFEALVLNSNEKPPELSSVYEEPGILYGILSSGLPLLLNRFSSPPHSELILGKTGTGKTLFAKAVSLRYRRFFGSEVHVIDPLGDYSEEIEAGAFLQFSKETLQRMRKKRGGIILIDEGWKEIWKEPRKISELFRVCRHYGWGVTLITQDPSDLRGMEELLRNSKYLFLFSLPYLEPEWARILGVSGIEEEISSLRAGEAVLLFRGKWKFRTYLGDLK